MCGYCCSVAVVWVSAARCVLVVTRGSVRFGAVKEVWDASRAEVVWHDGVGKLVSSCVLGLLARLASWCCAVLNGNCGVGDGDGVVHVRV